MNTALLCLVLVVIIGIAIVAMTAAFERPRARRIERDLRENRHRQRRAAPRSDAGADDAQDHDT